MQTIDAPGRVRFGTFDFDPTTGELRRGGIPVRLQSQPGQVLALLIKQPGEVVTRDVLREAIWGANTFVDFDRGLNFCIAQIRAALGDSAESPRFVRTLPKRGYQFIAPVERLGAVVPVDSRTAAAAVRGRHLTTWHVAVSAVLAVLAAVLILGKLWGVGRTPSAQSLIKVAVVRFDNETDSSEFGRFADGLTDAVVAEWTTSGTGRYGVIGNAAILRQPRGQRDLGAIGASLHVGYVVLGQVQRNGPRIRVLAHLIRLPDQTHLWVTRFDRTLDDPLGVETELAQRIVAEFSRRLASERESPITSPNSVSD